MIFALFGIQWVMHSSVGVPLELEQIRCRKKKEKRLERCGHVGSPYILCRSLSGYLSISLVLSQVHQNGNASMWKCTLSIWMIIIPGCISNTITSSMGTEPCVREKIIITKCGDNYACAYLWILFIYFLCLCMNLFMSCKGLSSRVEHL